LRDEATLLERVRQYDTEALAQVYDDYYDRIYRYIYRYLGQADAAEDLTAGVFFRLLSAIRRGKSPRTHLSAWLYRVAHNLVVDVFRRMPPEELELAEWLESEEGDPVETAQLHMQMDRVRLALRQLTAGQQQVIMLKFFVGMDTREAAATMGRSEGAVDALQHRALHALRKILNARQGPGAASTIVTGSEQDNDSQHATERDGRTPMIGSLMLQRLLTLLGSASRPPAAVRRLPGHARKEAENTRPAWEVVRCRST
jgi:RNA polymerase sigma-70 factor (ECF subfamily)